MRSLHADLTAAQIARQQSPVVALSISDDIGGAPRPHPEIVYNGSEAITEHDVVVTANAGVILRARLNAGNFDQNRVTDPDSSPSYSTWGGGTFGGGTGTTLGIGALHDAGGVRAAQVIARGTTAIRLRWSANEGSTYSASVDVATPATAPSAIDVACRTSDDDLVVWIEGTVLHARRVLNDGATVGADRTSGIAFASANSVSVDFIGDEAVIVFAGATSAGVQFVYETTFDWTANAFAAAANVKTLAQADAGLGHQYSSAYVNTAGGNAVATWVENYTAASSFTRIMGCWLLPGETATSELWSQPRPIMNLTDTIGMAVAQDAYRGGYFWSRPDKVYRSSPVTTLSIPQSKILGLQLTLEPYFGELVVHVDDSTRTYEPYVQTVTHPLSPGAEVTLELGYETASGDRTSELPHFWIHKLETVIEDGRRRLIITARDVHTLLDEWHPRDALEYRASRSPFSILNVTCARAGVDYTTTSTSSNLTALLPDWFHDTAFIRWLRRTRPPGWQSVFYRDKVKLIRHGTPLSEGGEGITYERKIIKGKVRWDVLERLLSPPLLLDLESSATGLSAVQRILSTVKDVSYGQTFRFVTKNLDSAEASGYTYGAAAGHAVRRARYARRAAEYNHVMVWGGVTSNLVRSVVDWTELKQYGRQLITTIRDLAADTDAKADERGESVLRPAAVAVREDIIEVRPNVGQELWDVVTLTEAIAGNVTSVTRRVTAIRILLDQERGEFVQWLTLGSP